MNIAFMAKLGWKLMKGEDCLWVEMFKKKYAINPDDCSTWKAKASMSNAWRGVLKSVPILIQGAKKHVRNWHEYFILA